MPSWLKSATASAQVVMWSASKMIEAGPASGQSMGVPASAGPASMSGGTPASSSDGPPASPGSPPSSPASGTKLLKEVSTPPSTRQTVVQEPAQQTSPWQSPSE